MYTLLSCLLLVLGAACVPIQNQDGGQTAASEADDICCVPGSWEALMYLDYGTVFIDQNTLIMYLNGTVNIAFSYPLKKLYLKVRGIEQSPLIPKPVPSDTDMLYDFTTGTQYMVTNGKCDKSKLDTDMPRQCVPGNAKHVSSGIVNGNMSVSTYQFMSGDSSLPFQITGTVYKRAPSQVEPVTCDPVQVQYWTPSAETGSGTLIGLTVMDIGPIRNTSVFDVPGPCQ